MGYSTDFKGELKFKEELKASEISFLNTYLEKDRRDIGFEDDSKVYVSDREYWYHINLMFNEDFSGIKWNGSEKTYNLPEIINWLLKLMKEQFNKEFVLEGKLFAQGEEYDDKWELIMIENIATNNEIKLVGQKIKCPICEEYFILEDKGSK